MLMISIILIIIFIGLVLTVLELFFIPGTTLVGMLGILFSIAGVVITYKHFGPDTGLYVLIATSILKIGIIYFSFQRKAWTQFSLKSSIESKVNEGITEGLEIGHKGKTVSTLRPIGKAQFNNREYEVKTSGTYLDHGIEIRIIQISSNQITVEPTN
jgi:membrane-bound ClpP family serine protease